MFYSAGELSFNSSPPSRLAGSRLTNFSHNKAILSVPGLSLRDRSLEREEASRPSSGHRQSRPAMIILSSRLNVFVIDCALRATQRAGQIKL